MSQEQNQASVRRLIEEGFGKGDLAVFDELFAPNFVEHQNGVRPPTVEGVKAIAEQLHAAFPDFRCTVEDIAADGEKVWVRLSGGGTQLGPLFGHPPTGKTARINIIDICRFENGKIVEHWGVPDNLSLMQQLGFIP